eukprot:g5516.t1
MEYAFTALHGTQSMIKLLAEGSKVLRLEKEVSTGNSALNMNQRLDGHQSTVCAVSWNDKCDRLISADESGVIIVWNLSKGHWNEELMSENKCGKVVRIRWDDTYEKMCIVYDKGYILVGNIEGKRHWSKDLNVTIFDMEWSPDSTKLLVAMSNARYGVYDSTGEFLTTVKLDSVNLSHGADARCLAMGLANGVVYLLKDETDDKPVTIVTGLQSLTQLLWSHNGKTIAVSGSRNPDSGASTETELESFVIFFSYTGTKLFCLNVAGSGHIYLAWDSKDTRLALCCEAHLFTAKIKNAYKWCWFSTVFVYSFEIPNASEHCVNFFNFNTKEAHGKRLSDIIAIASCDDVCAIISKDTQTKAFSVLICNAIGVLVTSKALSITPERVTMNGDSVIVTSSSEIWCWEYREQVERAFEDGPVAAKSARTISLNKLNTQFKFSSKTKDSVEQIELITAISCGDSKLCIGTNSNTLVFCTLPELHLICTHQMKDSAQRISMNCNEASVAVISDNGTLNILTLHTSNSFQTSNLQWRAKEVFPQGVWDLMWSKEDPSVLAVMEKSQMIILRDFIVEERHPSVSYLCHFSDLKVETVDIDKIMLKSVPSKFELSKIIKSYETKQLKEIKELLDGSKFDQACKIAEEHYIEVLWNMIGEAGLIHREYTVAEKAFLRCQNFYGIKFTRRLAEIKVPFIQEALAAAYLGRFDEAVEIYLRNERFDSAIELRIKTGNLFQAEKLAKQYGADDQLRLRLWNAIGEYYEDNKQWTEAVQYYTQAKNSEKLMEAYFALGDVNGMKQLIRSSPQSSELLTEIGDRMECLGVCDVAVEAFVKSGDTKRAIDCCCRLNEWKLAISLATREGYDQIGPLIQRQVDRMISKDDILSAIELLRRTGQHLQASRLLIEITGALKLEEVGPVLLKKLHVLSALEVSKFAGKLLSDPANITMQNTETVAVTSTVTGVSKSTAAQTLAGLMTLDEAAAENSDLTLDDTWHFAEAFHFYILAQKLLLRNQNEDAMRAMEKLKQLSGISDVEREAYKELEGKIFNKVSPTDPKELREIRHRQTRRHTGRDFCLLTARLLRTKDKPNRCKICRHIWCRSFDRIEECSLCHHKINKGNVREWPYR